ncbi:hypothetical protein C2E25_06270 [Geothermobacter hydrogeniphilus]|uniref:Amine oxidase domain-containing protein n=1 Tax=Geothermobacter hydrogeniphilus TaxID=1969733 RepID=A0A2K2HBK7_9BACT|nr:NAD(P)/FAD-dependent oxidoreductase [Geothermobacter hydrogeniphilus]PNU20647.1 hypothetical protein C2E25_06270 [Geothermobacter hydrogeniphilus]
MKQTGLVIGGGLSGLFCAGFLALLGYRVELFEAAPRLAPVVRGFWRDGWYFDTGFHYTSGLGEGGILARVFRFLGIADALQVVRLNPQGFDGVRFKDGEEFLFPAEVSELRRGLAERFPADAEGIGAFFNQIDRVCNGLPMLKLKPRSVPDAEVENAWRCSLQTVINKHIRDPRLGRLLSLHCLLHGVAPEHVPFAVHAGVAGLYYRGAHTLRGGGERLVEVLRATLLSLGVNVHCNAQVTAIKLRADRSIDGVCLQDGREFVGRHCIATLHPHALPGLLPDKALRPIYIRRLRSLQSSGSACCLFGYPKRAIPQLEGRNLYLEFDSANGQAPIYLTRGSGEAHSGVIAICPEVETDWNIPDYRERKRQRLVEIQQAIECHSPNLARDICWVDGGTPKTFQRYANAPVAGLYGAAHCLDQVNPQPRTRVEGLFLAGQAVVAPGLLGTALSAFWACQEMCGDQRLREGLMTCQ